MKKYYSDNKGLGVLSVLFLFLATGLIIASVIFLSFLPILMYIAIGVFAVAYFIVALLWLPAFFKNMSFDISPNEIVCNTGAFFRNKRLMKMSAMQYYTAVSTPFSEITGINFVILNALGGNIVLMFLSKEDLTEISDFLETIIKKRTEG